MLHAPQVNAESVEPEMRASVTESPHHVRSCQGNRRSAAEYRPPRNCEMATSSEGVGIFRVFGAELPLNVRPELLQDIGSHVDSNLHAKFRTS